MVNATDVEVIKRDGTKQFYEPDKIARVAQASGLSPIDAEELTEAINLWIESRGSNTVKSLEIRDRVFSELERRDKAASGLFAWYQSLKSKQTANG